MHRYASRIVIAAILLMVTAPLFLSTARAESLVSPNFEIDALGFFFADTPSDFAPPVISESSITVNSITATTAIVQWTTDVVSSSTVAYGLTSAYGTQIGQVDDRVKNHTVKLLGLSPNTLYHFQVISADAQGRFGRSSDQVLTTTKLASISEVQISDITLSSVIISWKTASVTTSTLLYGKTSDYGSTFNDESAGSTTTHTVRLSGLDSGTVYHFRIVGQDSGGQSNGSDDYVFTTQALPSISKLVIGTITGNTAEISWETNVPTDSFISFWNSAEDESKATTQGSPELVLKHHIVVTSLVGQTEYRFRVIGRDVNGNKTTTEPLSFKTPIDVTPPVITDVKSEISTNTKDDRLQLVVSWNTDEPAKSQIEYDVGAVANQKYKLSSREDTSLSVNHILIVPGLKPSTNYHFRIKATDATGNTGFSNDYSVLTPQKNKSLLQIILEKLEETFGWLRRVRVRG